MANINSDYCIVNELNSFVSEGKSDLDSATEKTNELKSALQALEGDLRDRLLELVWISLLARFRLKTLAFTICLPFLFIMLSEIRSP